MLAHLFKMYDYFLGMDDPEHADRTVVFSQFRAADYSNIPFRAFHIGHGYCPGYHEFGDGPVKKEWDTVAASPDWFNALGHWIEAHRQQLYPHINPDARIVFVYRNPFDFVVSMHKHLEDHQSRLEDAPIEITAFIERVMPQYMKSYISHVEGHRRYPDAIQLLSYERLMGKKAMVLRAIAELLRASGHGTKRGRIQNGPGP